MEQDMARTHSTPSIPSWRFAGSDLQRDGCLAGLLLLIGVVFGCGPVTADTPEPPASDTPTPAPTSTPAPLLTPTRPSAPSPTRVPTAGPTAAPLTGQPLSKYSTALSGQAAAAGGIFTLRRAEFWPDLGASKPQNGLYLVLVGELSSPGNQLDCSRADEFVLTLDGQTYQTSSALMDSFKPKYQWNFPGSFVGYCISNPAPTFVAYDTPTLFKSARLSFRDAPIELPDLGPGLAKSGLPQAGLETQLRAAVEKVLLPDAHGASRLQELKLTDSPPPAGARTAAVRWVLADVGNDSGNRDIAKADASKIFQALYTSGPPLNLSDLTGVFRTVDVFGNAKEDVVMRLTLDKPTADKINWASFQSRNIYTVSKAVFLDPRYKDTK
jgi:hypothetical protein